MSGTSTADVAPVRFGFRIPPLSAAGGPELLVELAIRAERFGLSSFWVPDRLVPVGRYLSFAAREPLLEPLTALSLVAGHTSRIALGTGVVIAPLRHPLVLAKAAATVHHLSGERLILGLGTGWAPEEFAAVQTPRHERGARTDETIAILRTAFTGETFDHHGTFFDIEGVRLDPPSQRPPRLWGSGGGGGAPEFSTATASRSAPSVVRRLARLDGWLTRPAASAPQIEAEFREVAEEADRIGRDPSGIELAHVNFAHLVDGPRAAALEEQRGRFATVIGDAMPFERQQEIHWTGSLSDVATRVQQLVDVGVEHIVLHPLVADPDQIDLWVEGVLAPLGFRSSAP